MLQISESRKRKAGQHSLLVLLSISDAFGVLTQVLAILFIGSIEMGISDTFSVIVFQL